MFELNTHCTSQFLQVTQVCTLFKPVFQGCSLPYCFLFLFLSFYSWTEYCYVIQQNIFFKDPHCSSSLGQIWSLERLSFCSCHLLATDQLSSWQVHIPSLSSTPFKLLYSFHKTNSSAHSLASQSPLRPSYTALIDLLPENCLPFLHTLEIAH